MKKWKKKKFKKKGKERKEVFTMAAKVLVLENPIIGLGITRLQSGRSTIWANSPEHFPIWKLISKIIVIE